MDLTARGHRAHIHRATFVRDSHVTSPLRIRRRGRHFWRPADLLRGRCVGRRAEDHGRRHQLKELVRTNVNAIDALLANDLAALNAMLRARNVPNVIGAAPAVVP